MSYEAERCEVGGLVVRVIADDDPPHPREDGDNLGTIWASHKRYALGDEDAGKEFGFGLDDFGSWLAVQRAIRRDHPGAIVLDVWLYDHSGIRLSTEPFYGRAQHADWDSGQVGLIYALPAKVREWCGWPRLTAARRERAREILRSEVEALDQYVGGDVWGYVIEDADGEELDASWGIYGLDAATAEGKAAAECLAQA